MESHEMATTIAGIKLGVLENYDSEVDVHNEIEIVTRLREMPDAEFRAGMQKLVSHLHTLPKGLSVDRYITLLVLVAGGEPETSE